MASEEISSSSMPFRSKKTLHHNPKSSLSDQELLSFKTPEKPAQQPSRTRNRKVLVSIKEVRRASESIRESEPQLSHDRTDGSKWVRRQIDSWPDGSPSRGSKAAIDEPKEISEKFEILSEFFDSLVCAMRLLRLKGSAFNFSNICTKIECLTDRRFSYGHLAQLKFILPEVIELKKILVFDERTSCMKPDLHISLNFGRLDNQGNLVTGSQSMYLRKLFRTRLSEFLSSHSEIDEVPKDLLPEPFNRSSQDLSLKTSSLSPVKTSIEQPAISSTNVEEGMFFNHSEESQDLHVNAAPESMLSITTATGPSKQKKLIGASHLSQSFSRYFSQKVVNREAEKTDQATKPCAQNSSHSHTETSSEMEFCDAVSSSKVSSPVKLPSNSTNNSNCLENYSSPIRLSALPFPTTPSNMAGRSTMTNEDDPSAKTNDIDSTPAKLVSTPVQLMTNTPAMPPPKRSSMSPDDDSTCSASKLVGRTPRSRSLIFDTPTKEGKNGDDIDATRSDDSTCSASKLVRRTPRSRSLIFDTPTKEGNNGDEIDGTRSASLQDDNLDVLPQRLLQSIREKERKAKEEQMPAISQAKRRQKMIANLPKLFNAIFFLFHKRTIITKEELIHKIIAGNLDIVDRREVEEQLDLMLELVPEWISEKLASSGDLLLCVDKLSSTEMIRARLEEAK